MPEFEPAPVQNETHPYQKLGGWLWLLTVPSLILTPYSIFILIRDLIQFPYAQSLECLLFLLIKAAITVNIGFNLAANIMVMRRRPLFLRVRQIGFFVTSLQMLLTFANTVVTTDDDIFALFGLMMIPMLLVMIPIVIYLFMLYYFRSVRVRTYMGSDEYLRLAFFTKKIEAPAPAAPDVQVQNFCEGETQGT